MKELIALLCACASAAFAGDTFHFTENLTDSHGQGGNVTNKDRVTLNASLTIPGLANEPLDDSSPIVLDVGGLHFSEVISNASQVLPNSTHPTTIVFKDDAESHTNGRLTFTRAGDHLIITGSADNLTDDNGNSTTITPAQNWNLANGVETGPLEYHVRIGTLEKTGTVFFKATKRVTGSGENRLRNYTVSGDVDATKPTITITSPHQNERVLTDSVTVSGRASDNIGIQTIEVFVNGNSVGTVQMNTNGTWSTSVQLAPGQNEIEVQASDLASNSSSHAKVKVNRVISAPLNLVVDSGGTIRGGTNTQPFEVGKQVTLVANPDPGYTFVGWEVNGTNRTSAALPFKMLEGGATVHAIFAPKDYTGLFIANSADAVTSTNIGYFTASRAANGTISGKLIIAGRTVPFSGKHLSETNTADFFVVSGGRTNHVQFAINDKTLTGTVDDGTTSSALTAYAAASSTQPFAGKYTAAIHANGSIVGVGGQTNDIPHGHGPLLVTVTKNNAIFTGTLPDGTPITGSAPLLFDPNDSNNRVRVPLYASIQGGKHTVVAWVIFMRETPEGGATRYEISSESGYWVKRPTATDKLFKNGFVTAINIFGAKYIMPVANANALGFTNAVVYLAYGNLNTDTNPPPAAIFKPATATKNKVTLTDDPVQTQFPTAASLDSHINIAPGNGTVNGDFKHPVTGARTRFNGVVIQGQSTEIVGYFVGTDAGGDFVVFNGAP